jgi:hypothetical protein
MRSVVRDMVRAEFRKQKQDLTPAEVKSITDEALRKYDQAAVGETIRVEHRGAVLRVEKLEVANDVAEASRHDQFGAINRVSGKIAFELAARELGADTMLNSVYDNFRSWVLTGAPDLAGSIEVVKEPDLQGGDAVREHTVRLRKDNNLLVAEIEYFGAYIVRVTLGSAPAKDVNWARRFPLEEDRE